MLQYRYEGDFLDPNGGQTRVAVLSFMEEYVIQKYTLDFVSKIAFLEPGTHPLPGYGLTYAETPIADSWPHLYHLPS